MTLKYILFFLSIFSTGAISFAQGSRTQVAVVYDCIYDVPIRFASIVDDNGKELVTNEHGEYYFDQLSFPIVVSKVGYFEKKIETIQNLICLEANFQNFEAVKVELVSDWKLFKKRIKKTRRDLLKIDTLYGDLTVQMMIENRENKDTLFVREDYKVAIVSDKKSITPYGYLLSKRYFSSDSDLSDEDKKSLHSIDIFMPSKNEFFQKVFAQEYVTRLNKYKYDLQRSSNVLDTFSFNYKKAIDSTLRPPKKIDSTKYVFSNGELRSWSFAEKVIEKENEQPLNNLMLNKRFAEYSKNQKGLTVPITCAHYFHWIANRGEEVKTSLGRQTISLVILFEENDEPVNVQNLVPIDKIQPDDSNIQYEKEFYFLMKF